MKYHPHHFRPLDLACVRFPFFVLEIRTLADHTTNFNVLGVKTRYFVTAIHMCWIIQFTSLQLANSNGYCPPDDLYLLSVVDLFSSLWKV